MCADRSNITKLKKQGGVTCPNVEYPTPDPTCPQQGTPYSPQTSPTAEHPTHCLPAPPRNTLVTLDLPQPETPYSPGTCPTAEHPTHHRPASPRNTLVNANLGPAKYPNPIEPASLDERSPLNNCRTWETLTLSMCAEKK